MPIGGARIMKEVSNSEFTLKVDLVLLAMGFLHVKHTKLLEDFGIELDERGNIKSDGNYATSIPDVYTAGDANIAQALPFEQGVQATLPQVSRHATVFHQEERTVFRAQIWHDEPITRS